MLALSSNGRRSRSWLQDRLWSHKPEKKGRASLRQELFSIRKHFEAYCDRLIWASGDDIILDLSKVLLDINGQEIPPHWELLEGFDLNDPVFQDWLSEERAYLYARLDSQKTSQPISTPDKSGQKNRQGLYPRVLVESIESMGEHDGLASFAAGLAQELNTVMGAVSGTYQILTPDSNLGHTTDYTLNGTVRFNGFFRINVFVIDSKSTEQVWSGRFNTRSSDLFFEQERISKEIVDALLTELSDGAWSEYWRDYETSTAVWEIFQKGRVQEHLAQKRSLLKAIDYYRSASRMDPEFVPARISLAFCLLDSLRLCIFEDEAAAVSEVRRLISEILKQAPRNLQARALTAFLDAYDGKFLRAVETMASLCASAPQSPEMLAYFGAVCGYAGDYSREQTIYSHALTFTRHPPVWILTNLAFSILLSGKACDDPLLDQVLDETRSYQRALVAQAANLARKGRVAEASEFARRIIELDPDFRSEKWRSPRFFSNKDDHLRIAAELRKAGVP